MEMKEILAKLQEYDTPSITNVVASYPGDKEGCLGLYNPWNSNWYTDQSIKCIFPELKSRVGYAVTVRYGMPDANFDRLDFGDVLEAIDKSPKPVIVVIDQNLPEHIKNKSGLCGGNMTTAMKRAGAVGVVSNGPSRDMHEIRPMEFQYLLTGVTPGHGDYAIEAVNVPVSVCGMDVCPGEIVHMDESGACKFPADKAEKVLELIEKLLADEAAGQKRMRETKDIDELIALNSTKKKKRTM